MDSFVREPSDLGFKPPKPQDLERQVSSVFNRHKGQVILLATNPHSNMEVRNMEEKKCPWEDKICDYEGNEVGLIRCLKYCGEEK